MLEVKFRVGRCGVRWLVPYFDGVAFRVCLVPRASSPCDWSLWFFQCRVAVAVPGRRSNPAQPEMSSFGTLFKASFSAVAF